MKTITAQALKRQMAEGGVSETQIIDVRTPAEHREISIAGVERLPLDQFSEAKAREIVPEKTMYLLCKSGARSAKALAKLSCEAVVVEGGIEAWESEGFPVDRGKAMMSLERQVRIAAGSLVFIGVLLGLFLNPYFLIIPGFVGAGLAFAGITDTCGMGMMLAKMPWNRA